MTELLSMIPLSGVFLAVGFFFGYFILFVKIISPIQVHTAIWLYSFVVAFSVVFTNIQDVFWGSFSLHESNSILGAMVAGVIILPVLGNYFMKSTWKIYADYLVPSIVLFQSFGKVGCYFAGCCYGIYCSNSRSILLYAGTEYQKRIPVQLYESVSLFLMFLICIYLNRTKKLPDGFLAGLYILFYGIHRFVFEFIRADGIILKYLTLAQYISVFLSLTALLLLWYSYKKR